MIDFRREDPPRGTRLRVVAGEFAGMDCFFDGRWSCLDGGEVTVELDSAGSELLVLPRGDLEIASGAPDRAAAPEAGPLLRALALAVRGLPRCEYAGVTRQARCGPTTLRLPERSAALGVDVLRCDQHAPPPSVAVEQLEWAEAVRLAAAHGRAGP